MLLNCIVLGATMLFVFYKADKLDVVDEGYDENKQKPTRCYRMVYRVYIRRRSCTASNGAA